MSERELSTRSGSLHHGRNAGVALIAAGAVAASMIIVPTAARADYRGWPQGTLNKADATSVKKGQFIARSQFDVWRGQLDQVGPAGQPGLRAAGSGAHANYIDRLVGRMLLQLGRTSAADLKATTTP